ncbi:MAG: hypothetical protein JJU11_18215 [Candidatus Sumerlaeia bacterium]|nr:hypothetical protein [Candidatus Sumerlaeia bacterium]
MSLKNNASSLIFLLLILLSVSMTAQAQQPSWFVEETSGTIRLLRTNQTIEIDGTERVAVYARDTLFIPSHGAATIYTGQRMEFHRATERPIRLTVPNPPPSSSSAARMLLALANQPRQAQRAGMIVREPSVLTAQLVLPAAETLPHTGEFDVVPVEVLREVDEEIVLSLNRLVGDRWELVRREKIPNKPGVHEVNLGKHSRLENDTLSLVLRAGRRTQQLVVFHPLDEP